jgi:hypothetical protein
MHPHEQPALGLPPTCTSQHVPRARSAPPRGPRQASGSARRGGPTPPQHLPNETRRRRLRRRPTYRVTINPLLHFARSNHIQITEQRMHDAERLPEIEPPSRRGRRDLSEIFGFPIKSKSTLSRRKPSNRGTPNLSHSGLCGLCGSAVSPSSKVGTRPFRGAQRLRGFLFSLASTEPKRR